MFTSTISFPLQIGCILVLFATLACTPVELDRTLTGSWEFAYYEEVETGEQSFAPDHIPHAVTADFEDNGRKGIFDITTITNRIIGEYRLNEQHHLTVKEVSGTQMGEPMWVVPLWEALESANCFQRTENLMRIEYQNSTKALVFVPSGP